MDQATLETRLKALHDIGAPVSIPQNKETLVHNIIEASKITRQFATLDVDTLVYIFTKYDALVHHLNTLLKLDGKKPLQERVGQGNVAAILPYNGPLMTFALAFAGAYLFPENSFEIKPAGESQKVFEKFIEMIPDADMAMHLYNANRTPRISTESGMKFLTRHLSPASGTKVIEVYGHDSMITPEVEKMLMANTSVRYILEGPGKNWFVVGENPASVRCAETMLKAGLLNSGQSCMAGEIYVIHDSVYEKIIDYISKLANHVVVGDPHKASTDVGPLKNSLAKRIEEQVKDALEKGATIAYCSKEAKLLERTEHFYDINPERFRLIPYDAEHMLVPVIILKDVTSKMKVRHDETFGPVIAIGKYHHGSEIIPELWRARYGLEATVFGSVDTALMQTLDANFGHIFQDAYFLDPGQFDILLSPWGGKNYSRFSLQGITKYGNAGIEKIQTGPDYIVLDFSKEP
ncbi:aldehyde dehydrogenase family protein [Candidatus Woesearchaeota archaeon]|nr:MAG: aldehyde dehydrogenase family protein [Candidatus Woesearchaeota archaeon]